MTKSYWRARDPLPRYPPVSNAAAYDVVVVGAGITGITAAYLLGREGRRVALIERRRCADVDTSSTSAHLTCVTDTSIGDLVRKFGEDHATAVWDAGLAAINEMDELVRRHRIPCEFQWVPGYLHLPVDVEADTKAADGLRADAELASRLGFDATYLDEVPFVRRPGIRFDGQARFSPRPYLRALLTEFQRQGGDVFEHSEVTEIKADPMRVCARGHELKTDDVVVATHNPATGAAGWVGATLLQTKLSLYTSYVVAAHDESRAIPDALFWDTNTAYRYIRKATRHDHDVIIFGGEDHKTGQAEDTRACERRLSKALLTAVPAAKITHQWSGQVIETHDGLPLIGYTADHQFAATGFAGNGLTFGTLAAMMARDAILGQANPWRSLFDIHRTHIH
jgi:glycine/D-amino acid oxidase-like deaminating enzyme